jgi:hypothetical protein
MLLALLATVGCSSSPLPLIEPVELHVCCGCGDDSAKGSSRDLPLNTLVAAQDRLISLRPTTSRSRGGAIVFVSGTCSPPRQFGPLDGGSDEASRVTYRGYPGEAPAVVSGGLPVPATALQPVTGPDYIIEQINASEFITCCDTIK